MFRLPDRYQPESPPESTDPTFDKLWELVDDQRGGVEERDDGAYDITLFAVRDDADLYRICKTICQRIKP